MSELMRPWLKVRLPANQEAYEALTALAEWRRMRQTPTHVIRALRLYRALLTGDTDLLLEYFPRLFIRLAVPMGSSPAPAARPTQLADLEVTYQAKDEQDDIDDFLSEF
jgi:hypothetical protein